jgi:IS5 family transposase
MVKALLLAMWHDLSDVKLAEALDDRASFRRFCGFARHEATPGRTAFVRFRRLLVAHGLDGQLFEVITAQLREKAITIKTGTLVEATIIASASKDDDEGRWVKHKGKPAIHGLTAHIGADAGTALVEKIAVTPANVNDGRAGGAVIPDDPGEGFVSRYPLLHGGPGQGWHATRGRDGLVGSRRTGLQAWNQPIHRIRGRIEKIFGT